MNRIYFLMLGYLFTASGYSQNDECANAIALTPEITCSYTIGSFNGTTLTGPAAGCASASLQDIWYKFVATDAEMSIDLSNSIGINSALEVYEGSCSGTVVNCQNFNGPALGESYSNTNFIVGTTYYVRVLNAEASFDTRTVGICIRKFPAGVANNECANAITLTPDQTYNPITGTFEGSNMTDAKPWCASGASQDVWYKFVATEKMNLITLSGTTGVSNGFEMYYSACNGTNIFCQNANNGTGSGETFYYSNYIIGETYYIRVFNAFSAPTTGTFTICVQSFPAPTNDDCADAIAITLDSACATNTFTFSGASLDGSSATSCSPNPSQDVWYKFVAINSMMSINLAGASDVSTAFEIYDGSCSGAMIICRNTLGQGLGEFLYFNNIVIGNTYYVRVINAYATPSVLSGTICIRTYAPPANDLCVNAITLAPNSTCVYTPVTFSGAILDGNTVTSCSSSTTQDVWYKFTATNTTMTITITGAGEASNNAFEIYDGSCSGAMLLCRNANTSSAGETANYNGFTVGNQYYVRVENVFAYPLSVADFNICLTDPTLSTNENNTNKIEIFPNPATDIIHVLNATDSDRYELYNQLGQIVKAGTFETIGIPIQDIGKGVYLLRIITDLGTKVRKIIKE